MLEQGAQCGLFLIIAYNTKTSDMDLLWRNRASLVVYKVNFQMFVALKSYYVILWGGFSAEPTLIDILSVEKIWKQIKV